MPERSEYAPGTPAWVDLGTSDLEAAKTFYSGLFGWGLQDMGPEAGGYTMATVRGKQVAGLGPLMAEGQPTAWTTYVYIEDADATAKEIEAAGGTVFAPPFDVMTAGRMGVFADPTGAVFAIWQPRDHKGAQLVGEAGALCWNELHTRDPDRAKQFYHDVFGWTGQTSEMDGMTYTEWKLGDETVGGMMPMGDQFPAEVPPHWLAYFAVDDCDATVAKAGQLGGSVLSPAMDIPQGRFAVVADPQGAAFGVIKLAG
ncbi:MAG TPA: VOC family protein [Acidimicrobiales bacterium]|nr:VOC family protein [Acidimicrobiales bacterium]